LDGDPSRSVPILLDRCYNQSHSVTSYSRIDAEEHVTTYDLGQLFGAVADQLPEAEEAMLVIAAATLPQLPPRPPTHQLVIRAGRHDYHSYTHACVDELHVQAHKRTYCLLGLCFLAKVFHSEPREVHLQLTNPHSISSQ